MTISSATEDRGGLTFHALVVKDVKPETRDAIAVSFEVPPELRERFRFTQGQHVTLKAEIGGEEVRRTYSICSAPHEGQLRVAIKRVGGGRFSPWAHAALVPGASVAVAPPEGRFGVPLHAANRRHYLGFAAGSGITPMLSIVKTTLVAEPHSTFTLVYGNRASSTTMFRQELQDLKDTHLGRFVLLFVMSREQQEIDLLSGRIDKQKCEALFDSWIDLAQIDTTFICGPEAMTREIAAALAERGIDPVRVKTELFLVAGERPRRRVEASEAGAAASTCHAEVRMDGRVRTFEIVKGAESVLDAALRQGVELPYSCKGGVCSTCRTLLVKGEVDMDVHYALEDYEIKRGYILACQSFPVSSEIGLDYDEVSHA